MGRALQDLRFALRTLRKRPAFISLAVTSLALGIAANTLIFSMINEVFLTPLPIEDPARIVRIQTADAQAGFRNALSHLNWVDLREQNDKFSHVAGFDFTTMSVATGTSEPSIRTGFMVSGNYFDALGVKPAQGRFFLPEEDSVPGGHPVAVLHHVFWQEELGGDPGVVGQTVKLNGSPFTIIGVAPAGFDGLNIGFEPVMWVPMAMNQTLRPDPELNWYDERRGLFLQAFGRIAPGIEEEQAAQNLDIIGKRLAQEYPDENEGRSFGLQSLADSTLFNRDATTRGSALLMGAVAIVLLIACANVASLLLAQATERRKEIALRLALGIQRRRLVRQLLTESLLIATVGGVLGIALAWVSRAPVGNLLGGLPGGVGLDLTLDVRVLLFTLGLSVLTGILFGLFPAIQASRPELVGALKEAGDLSDGTGRRFTARRAIVVGQLALAVVSLVAAALFIRSLDAALDIELGYATDELVALGFNVGMQGYTPEQAEQFFRRAEETVAALPGVDQTALAQGAPLQGTILRSVILEGENPERRTFVQVNVVGPRYFDTAGVELEQGRPLEETDRAGQVPVVVVNRAMADKYWPGQDAVGKRFSFFGMEPVEVIGVAKMAKYNNPGETPQPYAYLPLLQNPVTQINVLARTTADPEALLLLAETELRALDPDLVINGRTVAGAVQASLTGQQTTAFVLGGFGGVALVLAAIGIYGVMAFAVRRRQREIGIRLALGAEPRSVVGLVLRDGLALASVGLTAGVLTALAVTRMASQLLFVSPTDPAAFAGTVVVLLTVAVGACLAPSFRASRIDPIRVLRQE